MHEPEISTETSIWSFEGRSSRSEYFFVLLLTSILGSICGFVLQRGGFVGALGGIGLALTLWVSMCTVARRLHDLGLSGWLSLITLIPLVNLVLGIYVLFAPGTQQKNIWGLPIAKQSAANSDSGTVEKPVAVSAVHAPVTQDVGVVVDQHLEARSEDPSEVFWAQALQESESATRKPGMWAKAYADANGDDRVARATYIRLRANQLQVLDREEQLRIQAVRNQEIQAEQARLKVLADEHQAVLAQMNQAEREEALLPKGKCSACGCVIPLTSENCQWCTASFAESSRFKIKPLTKLEALEAEALQRKKSDQNDAGIGEVVSLILVILFVLILLAIFFGSSRA